MAHQRPPKRACTSRATGTKSGARAERHAALASFFPGLDLSQFSHQLGRYYTGTQDLEWARRILARALPHPLGRVRGPDQESSGVSIAPDTLATRREHSRPSGRARAAPSAPLGSLSGETFLNATVSAETAKHVSAGESGAGAKRGGGMPSLRLGALPRPCSRGRSLPEWRERSFRLVAKREIHDAFQKGFGRPPRTHFASFRGSEAGGGERASRAVRGTRNGGPGDGTERGGRRLRDSETAAER